ncbi:MAG TPA: S8 family serine peptidase [Hyphomicrobiaceae bacterium]|nr:S8 family serine peptidase [Hyphomicrobiaceae bacterium]
MGTSGRTNRLLRLVGAAVVFALPVLASTPTIALTPVAPHAAFARQPAVSVDMKTYDQPRTTSKPPSPRGGVGIRITPGILAIPQLLEKDEPKSSKAKSPATADITCRGGSVRRGRCVCPGSKSRETIGPNAYLCKDKPPAVVTVTPPTACIGGILRKGQCRCPSGKNLLDGVCRTIDKSPPVVAEPGPALPPVPPTIKRGSDLPPTMPAPTPPAVAALDEYVPDEVLITIARNQPQTIDDAVAQSHNLQLLERLDLALLNLRIVRYRITDGRPVAAVVAALQADSRVEDPQPNYIYRASEATPAVHSAHLQYALAKVNAGPAHLLAHGRGALIAVIDSGIDQSHPDLVAAIAKSFDAVGDGQASLDPHGTAVAGIISARGTVQGIAPQARLLNVRAFRDGKDGQPASATTATLLHSLDWSIEQGARVLNLSFVGPRDPLIERAVRAAYDRRAIMIAAAGNGGPAAPPAYPAAYREVIAVTATDSADRRYKEANRGTYIAVAAPGVDILAPTSGHAHELHSGTSFAAAHVSGIVALMLERNPHLSPETARLALTAAANDLGPPGHDEEFGAGRVNAYGSLRMLDQAGAPSR